MSDETSTPNGPLDRGVRRRPKSYEGVKAHYTLDQLADLEKHANEMSRMDKTDKLKLINMARYALQVEDENKSLANELVLVEAILYAVMSTLNGEEVTDFMESFQEVQKVKWALARARNTN